MKPPPIAWPDARRHALFTDWMTSAAQRFGLREGSLRTAASDTGMRRYFRIDGAAASFVVMDAPPQHEPCMPFARMARLLRAAGLHVPQVHDWDEANGFMLLSDLGTVTYQEKIQAEPAGVASLCLDASESLVQLQRIERPPWLPAYDTARLEMELAWFTDWYLQGYCGMALDAQTQAALRQGFDALGGNALAQPQILVHRDYHCRNLMFTAPNPGILDFQGAVWGPAAYDLVSLLRDAYIEWDEDFQHEQAHAHWARARAASVAMPAGFNEFWRDFEWSGLQRQLKVLGFFARLSVRDGRHGYIADMPRVWGYACRTAQRYPELAPLARLLLQVDPAQHPRPLAPAT